MVPNTGAYGWILVYAALAALKLSAIQCWTSRSSAAAVGAAASATLHHCLAVTGELPPPSSLSDSGRQGKVIRSDVTLNRRTIRQAALSDENR